jgi:hypothetical protein
MARLAGVRKPVCWPTISHHANIMAAPDTSHPGGFSLHFAAMTTTPTLAARIASRMAPHVRSEAEQRALLDSALYGFDSVRSTIPVGQSADVFSVTCATKLLEHGRLRDGTHPLSRVLAALRDSLGVDPEWDRLIVEVEAGGATPPPPDPAALPSDQDLRDALVARFSLGELHTLAFDLGIDRDEIAGGTKSEYARELVTYCRNHQQLPALVAAVRKARPGAV